MRGTWKTERPTSARWWWWCERWWIECQKTWICINLVLCGSHVKLMRLALWLLNLRFFLRFNRLWAIRGVMEHLQIEYRKLDEYCMESSPDFRVCTNHKLIYRNHVCRDEVNLDQCYIVLHDEFHFDSALKILRHSAASLCRNSTFPIFFNYHFNIYSYFVSGAQKEYFVATSLQERMCKSRQRTGVSTSLLDRFCVCRSFSKSVAWVS